MSEMTALTVLERPEGESPSALMRRATDVAGVCREIVMRTAMDLKGKKYVKVEGWMSIAATYGCVCSIREVVEDERGNVRAIAELRRADGHVIATAEGFVGMDEAAWASRAAFARRGMSQTRAISRVCRSVFAFVVVLIDGNLETTPAEEMPFSGPAANDVIDVPVRVAPVANTNKPGTPAPVRDESTKVPYGKNRGKHLCDLTHDDLNWIATTAQQSVEANDKTWHAKNVKFLETVKAEVARRRG